MHRNKIFDILESLSPKNAKAFQVHFKKNYPNRNIEGGILEQLVKHHPHFGKNKATFEVLYQELFPPTMSEKIRSNTLNKLIRPLEDFLIWQRLQQNGYERDNLLAEVFKQQGLNELVLKKWKRMETDLIEKEPTELWTWTKQMKLNHESYFNPHQNLIKIGPTPLNNALDQLHHFYTAAQLRYACELYSRHNILKEPQPNIPGLETALNFALHSPTPYLHCYALTLQLIRNKEKGDYEKTKQKTIAHIDEFHEQDQHLLLNYLLNHTATKVRAGHQDFLVKLFELMKIFIPRKVFITDGYFNHDQFINIIDTAIKLKENEWAENFIEEWKSYLPKNIKADVVILSGAMVLFSRNEFAAAALEMAHFRSRQLHLELRGRWLFLQASYELGEREELDNHLDNLETFIRRKKNVLNPALLQGGLSIVHFTRRLIKPQQDKEKLKKDLAEATLIYMKNWFLKKIEDLED